MFEAIDSAHEVGALIKRRRKELGFDQATLAGKAGVSRLWISEIERGKDTAAIGLVFKTLAALGIILVPELKPASTRAQPDFKVVHNAAGDIDLDFILARARQIHD